MLQNYKIFKIQTSAANCPEQRIPRILQLSVHNPLQQALQGNHEAINRVGVQTCPGGQGPDAVKGTVDDTIAVDHHQFHGVFLLGTNISFQFRLYRFPPWITTGTKEFSDKKKIPKIVYQIVNFLQIRLFSLCNREIV